MKYAYIGIDDQAKAMHFGQIRPAVCQRAHNPQNVRRPLRDAVDALTMGLAALDQAARPSRLQFSSAEIDKSRRSRGNGQRFFVGGQERCRSYPTRRLGIGARLVVVARHEKSPESDFVDRFQHFTSPSVTGSSHLTYFPGTGIPASLRKVGVD